MNNFQIPTGYTARKQEELATITYVGYSELSTATDSGEWVVQKIEIAGAITTISYGQGAWDDRATLTYK